jgi:sigma-B regulation protein RsbU (phosphoserine phosphatase)
MESNDKTPVDEVSFLDREAQEFIMIAGRILSDPEDMDTALNQALNRVAEFLGAEAASIFVVDEPTGELVLRYAVGEVRDEVVGLRLPSGEGVVGWVVKNGEDLIVPYPGLDARFFEEVDARTGFSTRSILCGPIRTDGLVLGAIEVLNKTEGTFNDDDLVLLRAVCRLVAEAILGTGS